MTRATKTVDAYYDPDPLVDAIVALLEAHHDPSVAVVKASKVVTAPRIIVEALVPRPGFATGLSGPTHALVNVQLTHIGVDAQQANDLGRISRRILTARDWTGAFTTPIDLPGGHVDDVEVNVGAAVREGGVENWVEDYGVVFQASTATVLAS